MSNFDLRFHRFALLFVAAGATFAIGAALVVSFLRGAMATATIMAALGALAMAFPVWQSYREKRIVDYRK
ncbi:MAG TPA: hypothetical protein DDW52_21060 [Planctomycetaceae bacterium]|nr:hypothetical protein [Planctomycetaceae bacterium]